MLNPPRHDRPTNSERYKLLLAEPAHAQTTERERILCKMNSSIYETNFIDANSQMCWIKYEYF